MAGGSFANLNIKNKEFLSAASQMRPVTKGGSKQWELSNAQTGYIIYESAGNSLSAEPAAGNYDAVWINTINGQDKKDKAVKGGKLISMSKPAGGNWVLWLKKK
jgi:hypothetical protein